MPRPPACARKRGVPGWPVARRGGALALGLIGDGVMAEPVREVTAPLAAQAAAGTLKVDVHTVLPIEQAAEGLATLAGGRPRGKTVVKIAD